MRGPIFTYETTQKMSHNDLWGPVPFPMYWSEDSGVHYPLSPEIKPQRLNLIIKGNEFLATAHAAIRGIPIEVVRVLHDPTPHTTAKCSKTFEAIVQKWYHEDVGCDYEAGSALIGSLLYYGEWVGGRSQHNGDKLPG